MEERANNRIFVQSDLRQDRGNGNRMRDVGFAGLAGLAAVALVSNLEGVNDARLVHVRCAQCTHERFKNCGELWPAPARKPRQAGPDAWLCFTHCSPLPFRLV